MIGQGEYETYLNNVNYALVLDTLSLEEVEQNYASRKHKDFEAKYLDKVTGI